MRLPCDRTFPMPNVNPPLHLEHPLTTSSGTHVGRAAAPQRHTVPRMSKCPARPSCSKGKPTQLHGRCLPNRNALTHAFNESLDPARSKNSNWPSCSCSRSR